MKKIILSAIAIATMQLAQAQEAKTSTPMAQQQTATPEQVASREASKIQKNLQLTEEQRVKVYEAALTKTKAMQALKQKYASNQEAMRTEAKPIRMQFKKDVSAVLTPEQQQKMQQMMDEQKQNKQTNDAAAPAPAKQ